MTDSPERAESDTPALVHEIVEAVFACYYAGGKAYASKKVAAILQARRDALLAAEDEHPAVDEEREWLIDSLNQMAISCPDYEDLAVLEAAVSALVDRPAAPVDEDPATEKKS